MSKALRTRMVTEMGRKFKGVQAGVLVDYRGLSAGQADSLRKDLRSAKVEMDVIKNSLAKLAFKDTGLGLLEKHLKGQIALVHGPDPVTVAKKLLAWKDKNKKLEIRGGILGSDLLSVDQIKALSTMASREAILSQIAGLIAAPMSDFACCLSVLFQDMAGLLKALEEKKSAEGGAA